MVWEEGMLHLGKSWIIAGSAVSLSSDRTSGVLFEELSPLSSANLGLLKAFEASPMGDWALGMPICWSPGFFAWEMSGHTPAVFLIIRDGS